MNNRFTSALFVLFALLLATCEKPERNNPWDEKADPSAWAPKNLRISKISDYALKLEWDYNIKTHEGFRIERSVDNGSWEMLDSNLDPSTRSYINDGIDLAYHDYVYRVYAYLDQRNSNYAEAKYLPSIGEFYKGGIIFYLDGNGGGLVCTESDQSTDAEWGCYGTTIGGTGTGVGTGAANTAAIVAGCGESGIAARICNDLVLNGYSDWFLPSKDELNLMYQNLKLAGIGGFAGNLYWSSSETSSPYAWLQYFYYGSQYNYCKNNNLRVRAVRAF